MGKFNQRNKSSAHKRNNKKFAPDPCKSDEDIVKDSIHLFYLDIDELLTNPNTTRRYKKMLRTGIGNPPRPQNAFMLYRRNQMAGPLFINRAPEDKKAKFISGEIAGFWNNETKEVMKTFYALQRMAKKKHGQIYENYKFIRNFKNQLKIRKTETYEESSVSSRSSSTETFPESSPNEVIASPNSTNYVSQSSTESFEFDSIISSICDNIQDYDIIYDSFGQPYLFNTKTDQICFLPNINFDNYQTNEMMLNTSQQPCIIQQPELANIPQSYNELANTIQQPELANIPQQSYNELANTIQQPELANIPQQSYNELANTIQQPELPTIPQQSYNGPEFIQQPELVNIPQQSYNELANIIQQPELATIFQQSYNGPEFIQQPKLANIPQQSYNELANTIQQPELPTIFQQSYNGPEFIQQPKLANIPQQSYNELANTIQQPELPTIFQQSYNGPEFIQQPKLANIPQQSYNELANTIQQPELPTIFQQERIYDYRPDFNLSQQILYNMLFEQSPPKQDGYSPGCSYKKST
ncbi:Num1p [Rhizophagus irregularis DAOM 197198w]|uniref:Num1p n=1 Tax=Rhizophagus irregularis (strain DAOM 197198w) TaxID=1432141 RepID=A0A015LVH1_RHIIW|nr:Num1p [Rhizophagus irregularis DAOM 197198w]